MDKLRVMYIVHEYPQISQTYIKSEIEALADDYEIQVVALHRPDIPYKNHLPYRMITDGEAIEEAVEEFRPHVLHSHWLQQIAILAPLSRKKGVPFTIRAHSFDTIRVNGATTRYMREASRYVNDDNCLGVLSFPFTRPLLEKAGFRGTKIHECFPVVHYPRFHDRSPNGEAIMNVGACIPKKRMEDYLELATKLPRIRFNLYPMGHQTNRIKEYNNRAGNPVNINSCVEPEDMLSEYKKHRWLVYTACWTLKTVGWPMSIAEAQAAGVGVCMPNIRPDLREYVGDSGYLYNSLEEVIPLISGPVPAERREMGFEHAKKSDIFRHKSILTGLWDRVRSQTPRYSWTHGKPPIVQRLGWRLRDVSGKVYEKLTSPFRPKEQDDGL